jgi:hypothetical protein
MNFNSIMEDSVIYQEDENVMEEQSMLTSVIIDDKGTQIDLFVKIK